MVGRETRGHTGGGQNDGNTTELKIRIYVGTLTELQLATLDVLLPLVYTL
jgi:hypothetical protein